MENTVDQLIKAKDLAQNGIDYSPQFGAVCPLCKTPRAKVKGSLPWEENSKVRYHKCRNERCTLRKMNVTIKSIEIDQTDIAGARV